MRVGGKGKCVSCSQSMREERRARPGRQDHLTEYLKRSTWCKGSESRKEEIQEVIEQEKKRSGCLEVRNME